MSMKYVIFCIILHKTPPEFELSLNDIETGGYLHKTAHYIVFDRNLWLV